MYVKHRLEAVFFQCMHILLQEITHKLFFGAIQYLKKTFTRDTYVKICLEIEKDKVK